MHRTEGTNNEGNLFTNGPPGTRVEENWLNGIQEELAAVLENAGITLETADTDTRSQLSGILITSKGNVDFENTSLKVKGTDGTFSANLKIGSALSANRTINIVTGDSDQTLDFTAGDVFAAGTVMLFGQNSAPTGWTRKADWQDNAMICYASAGNINNGGGVSPQSTHTHTGPSHTHTVDAHTHTGPSHSHTVDSHNHTGPNHFHIVDAHTHTGPSHTHSVSISAHNHQWYKKNGATGVTWPVTGTTPYIAFADHWGGGSNTGLDVTASLDGFNVDGYTDNDGSASLSTGAEGTGATGSAAPNTGYAGTGNTGNAAPGTSSAGTGVTGFAGPGTNASGTAATGSNTAPYFQEVIAATKD